MSLMTNLREVNILREKEWDTSENGLDGSFYGNELAGEVGEAIELCMADYYGFSNPTMEEIGEELADVIICVDLLAMYFGIQVDQSIKKINDIEVDGELLHLAMFAGRACNITKKLERERLGLAGSRATLDDLEAELEQVLNCVIRLAVVYAIRLDVAVAAKFNKTSDKVGLQTKMDVPA